MNTLQCQPPWLSWFSKLDSDEVIKQAAYLAVKPVEGLQALHLEEACRRLEQAWKEIFVPGVQHIEILRSFVVHAAHFSASTSPTLKDYNRQRSAGVLAPCEVHSIRCLTGLAGVSKSSLVKAFERICALDNKGQFVSDCQRLTLCPVRRIGIGGQQSIRGVLEELANPVALVSMKRDNKTLMEHVRLWFSTTATSALIVDEMQFFTQSSTASVKTTQLIMMLASLGVPLIFVANYSLVNKLLQRPQEEKNRLLAAPYVVEPPAAKDELWSDSIKEYLRVAPDCFKIETDAEIEELHRLTAGLFRALRELLLQAYRETAHHGRSVVTMTEVRLAFGSRAYSAYRKDIEDLASLAITHNTERRPDLVCAFTERHVVPAAAGAKSKSPTQAQAFPSDVSAALIEGTLSIDAQATLRTLRRSSESVSANGSEVKVLRMPKRTAVSAQSLLDGASLFRKVTQEQRSGSKKKLAVETPEMNDENAS
ncbi:hypothetical protein [Rugamonas sp.]|uniref:hypothetical protein n=1 Tax=Rugamonas sp. TaxID=1926287 RepID=UPI0025DABD65|nr:hypothetical protein [Rugamonas sp.]